MNSCTPTTIGLVGNEAFTAFIWLTKFTLLTSRAQKAFLLTYSNFAECNYHRRWLLSACSWQQKNMCLTADVHLTRNSHLINGCKSSGRCFHCFRYITRSTWQSAKQIWRPVVREIVTLEWEEGNNNDKFAVSLLKDATVVGHVFAGVLILPQAEGLSLVKLLIEENVVMD